MLESDDEIKQYIPMYLIESDDETDQDIPLSLVENHDYDMPYSFRLNIETERCRIKHNDAFLLPMTYMRGLYIYKAICYRRGISLYMNLNDMKQSDTHEFMMDINATWGRGSNVWRSLFQFMSDYTDSIVKGEFSINPENTLIRDITYGEPLAKYGNSIAYRIVHYIVLAHNYCYDPILNHPIDEDCLLSIMTSKGYDLALWSGLAYPPINDRGVQDTLWRHRFLDLFDYGTEALLCHINDVGLSLSDICNVNTNFYRKDIIVNITPIETRRRKCSDMIDVTKPTRYQYSTNALNTHRVSSIHVIFDIDDILSILIGYISRMTIISYLTNSPKCTLAPKYTTTVMCTSHMVSKYKLEEPYSERFILSLYRMVGDKFRILINMLSSMDPIISGRYLYYIVREQSGCEHNKVINIVLSGRIYHPAYVPEVIAFINIIGDNKDPFIISGTSIDIVLNYRGFVIRITSKTKGCVKLPFSPFDECEDRAIIIYKHNIYIDDTGLLTYYDRPVKW